MLNIVFMLAFSIYLCLWLRESHITDKHVFTPDGKRMQTPKKGLNIIRRSDGTAKKVMVK